MPGITERCCGAECFLENDKEAQVKMPCWGQVWATDEICNEDYSDCYWLHACEGHQYCYVENSFEDNLKKYEPEPKNG